MAVAMASASFTFLSFDVLLHVLYSLPGRTDFFLLSAGGTPFRHLGQLGTDWVSRWHGHRAHRDRPREDNGQPF